MKKLMTTMLVALAAITTFGACEYISKDTAWVYKWKFTGKTTYGAKAKAPRSSGLCGYSGVETCSVRCPASLKIEGYTWICAPGCGDEFGKFAEVNEVFWTTKPGKYSLAGGIQNEIMHIIGKKAKQGEVGGTVEFVGDDMTYKFTYAGLGKYDRKNGRLTSASGSFAGFAEPCPCAATGYWDCESLSLICQNTEPTVVYGKWSVKLKKSDSKRFAKNGTLPKFPAWVRMKNLEAEEDASDDEGDSEGDEQP
jgi:hypothetical protein